MTSRPKLRLSRLRDIGWKLWDPLGLRQMEGGWRGSGAANEYDSYLIHVAVMVRQGAPLNEAAASLMQSEREHMGITDRADAYSRALATVTAIESDPDLWREAHD